MYVTFSNKMEAILAVDVHDFYQSKLNTLRKVYLDGTQAHTQSQ